MREASFWAVTQGLSAGWMRDEVMVEVEDTCDKLTNDFSSFGPGRWGERTPEAGEYGLLDDLPLNILHRLCLDEVVKSGREPP